MELSIIIPTMNRGDVFQKTLDAAIKAVEGTSCEIIVVNDSKTQKLDPKLSLDQKAKILENPGQGVASARNFGVKHASFDTLLFLDDDILIRKENLIRAFEFIQTNQSCAINMNWIYPSELTEKIALSKFGRYLIHNGFTSLKGWHKGLLWNDDVIFECELLASYFLMIRKSDFLRIGGYNENFPHAGAEDFEFAKRLNASGIKGFIDPTLYVHHNESDRVNLLPFLIRKQRSAETRKIANNMGYREMAIHASALKRSIILSLYPAKSVIRLIFVLIPNIKLLDKISFRIIDRLISIYLYKGFFNSKT